MLKKLLGETALYGLSSIFGRALNFLLLPFYARVFADTAEYGIITDLYVLMAFLNIVFTFGMETTFFRFATKHQEQLERYFRLALSVLMFISMLLTAVIFVLAPSIASLLGY
ncbi:MAG: oligosaccharide flippase family protein, partial [Bacteroidota bacterium]